VLSDTDRVYGEQGENHINRHNDDHNAGNNDRHHNDGYDCGDKSGGYVREFGHICNVRYFRQVGNFRRHVGCIRGNDRDPADERHNDLDDLRDGYNLRKHEEVTQSSFPTLPHYKNRTSGKLLTKMKSFPLVLLFASAKVFGEASLPQAP